MTSSSCSSTMSSIDNSSSPPLYHPQSHMFSTSHFSNEKLTSSPSVYPSFAMHGLNMNVNVTMSPVYVPTATHPSMPPSSSSPSAVSPAPLSTKPFYSSDDNGPNPLEGTSFDRFDDDDDDDVWRALIDSVKVSWTKESLITERWNVCLSSNRNWQVRSIDLSFFFFYRTDFIFKHSSNYSIERDRETERQRKSEQKREKKIKNVDYQDHLRCKRKILHWSSICLFSCRLLIMIDHMGNPLDYLSSLFCFDEDFDKISNEN